MSDELPIRMAPDNLSAPLDGTTIVLAATSGIYFEIGGAGQRVWAVLSEAGATTPRALAEAIVAEYDVDLAIAERDVMVFLDRLREAGLVQVA